MYELKQKIFHCEEKDQKYPQLRTRVFTRDRFYKETKTPDIKEHEQIIPNSDSDIVSSSTMVDEAFNPYEGPNEMIGRPDSDLIDFQDFLIEKKPISSSYNTCDEDFGKSSS